MSKVPSTWGSAESSIEPAPDSLSVPLASIRVLPVKVLIPVRVSVPAATSRPPPSPDSTPEKVSPALVSRRVWEPRVTSPLPASEPIMVFPLVAPEISSVPESTTVELARAPSSESFMVAPESISVAPK